MKIELDTGNNRKVVLDNVIKYDQKKSQVSGLLIVTVKYADREETYRNVFSVKPVRGSAETEEE